MAPWKTFTLAGVGLVAAGVSLALWFSSARWNSKTSRLIEALNQAAFVSEAKRITFKDFEQLPIPVAKYFRWALKEGQPLIRSARITQVGEFRARRGDDVWSRFEARQFFSAQPPRFVWTPAFAWLP